MIERYVQNTMHLTLAGKKKKEESDFFLLFVICFNVT